MLAHLSSSLKNWSKQLASGADSARLLTQAAWIPKDVLSTIDQLDLTILVPNAQEIEPLIAQTILFEGKRFRPLLMLLMGQALGVPPAKLLPYARAAELVHAATLAHDDVVDDSHIRRRRPTLKAKAGNNRAVLIGDLLLAQVMKELSALGHIRLIHSLSVTVQQLVLGEWQQLGARGLVEIEWDHLYQVAHHKTASLLIWCAQTPAILEGYPEEMIQLCYQFGYHYGLGFQMVDDVLDFNTSLEKPFAKDLTEGLVNFVSRELVIQTPHLKPSFQILVESPRVLHAKEVPWTQVMLRSAQQSILSKAQDEFDQAKKALEQMTDWLKQNKAQFCSTSHLALHHILDVTLNRSF
jgi:geranylgeranyl pyrophosphate synthase